MDKLLMEEKMNKNEMAKSHKFVSRGGNMIECTECNLRHGGLINSGREELRDDGHVYAIRSFGTFSKGDLIL